MNGFRVTVVREDGVSHSTDISGWSGETTAFQLFKSAKEDARAMFAVVFENHDVKTGKFQPRAEYKRA